MKHKIIVKNAVKRKPNCIYHIDSEGSIIEEPQSQDRHAVYRHVYEKQNTDDKINEESVESMDTMSDDDNKYESGGPPDSIRSQTLRNLLKALRLGPSLTVDEIMKELNISRRTAYDYYKTIQCILGPKISGQIK